MDKEFIFGAAYYEEYLPYDRLEQDMELMREAGMNTIRIAESTWSVEEPEPGTYDFSHVDRVIDAAQRHGIQVIIGTPTYAVPVWLSQLDGEVLAVTKDGPGKYGSRQNMDITNATYRKYAEGIIRALVSHTAPRKNVIGFQLDNETKHYNTAGPKVLERFRGWMEKRYGTVEAMNRALGLNYWSNSVTSFAQLPDPTGTINGSYACAFARFQRELVTEFLRWQADIVREYKRPDQFITNNFDYEWVIKAELGQQVGHSHGVQPDIDQYEAARALTLVGTDIYCPSQDELTGMEIAYGGDFMRSLRRDNYLVLESQAQGMPEWLPYPGQLRLMAYGHIASGARGVMYWHWSSIHNAIESYWKGVLSHDFAPNPTFDEAKRLGAELKKLSPQLCGLKKNNRIALVVGTDQLSALRAFPTDRELIYNDVVLWMYRALYELNLECDVISDREKDWSPYDLLLFPELYCASREMTERVRSFTEGGGTVFSSFRSFVADEDAQIYHDPLPHGLTDCFGMSYNQFTKPVKVTVEGQPARYWLELLRPAGAETVAAYQHKYWGKYAAVTRHTYGRGHAWYMGTMLPVEALKTYLLLAVRDAGIQAPELRWPLVLRSGTSRAGKRIRFLLNFSDGDVTVSSPWSGTELLSERRLHAGDVLTLPDWGVCILEEEPART